MVTKELRFGVITVSDRSASGQREDTSGALACDALGHYGTVVASCVVPDGIESVQRAIREAASKGAQIIFTTGGTGITRRDFTPQAVKDILSYEIPGIPELLRERSTVITAALSRSIAGVVDMDTRRVCVICLPGSPHGVTEGISILSPLFEHIASQLADGDHTMNASALSHHHHGAHQHADPSGNDSSVETEHGAEPQDPAQRAPQKATVVVARCQDTEISMAELEQSVTNDRAGAVLSFCGRVRNHDHGKQVRGIQYVGHPDASKVISDIAEEVAQREGVCALSVIHRLGYLTVGETALGACISTEHRREAYQAMEILIDRIKSSLPVWKKQELTSGEHEWTGMP